MSVCPVCGTSARRRTRAQIEALDATLHGIVAAVRPATVRQVFYQAVVRGLVPKCETHGYRPVQQRLLKLREKGDIPYGWITDNARVVRGHRRYSDPEEFAKEVAMRYRRDYWADAEEYVEVWIEKDGLAGVLYEAVVEEFGLDLYVTRGFSSITYLQEAAHSISLEDRPVYVYLLTDFDPAGMNIADKVEEELEERAYDAEVRVERIAVTPEQIRDLNLPTRPTKRPSGRSLTRYERSHGDVCVELDAIPPGTLRELVREKIERHMDPWQLRQMKMAEAEERSLLAAFSGRLAGGEE